MPKGILICAFAACVGCSKHENAAPAPSVLASEAMPRQNDQHTDQSVWIIKACGRPSRDYEDTQAGITNRHVIYGRQHIELIFERFPEWTYIGATDPRDTEYGAILEVEDVDRRLPCSRGKLRTVLDR
jgi:hypothetical protein